MRSYAYVHRYADSEYDLRQAGSKKIQIQKQTQIQTQEQPTDL